MNWNLLIPLLVTTAFGIVGWIVGHRLNSKRDREIKNRDLRLRYLIDAYRKLESAAGRSVHSGPDFARNIEQAVADIQLFGTRPQIELVHRMLAEHKRSGNSDLGPELQELRSDLRNELSLEQAASKIQWIRFEAE